MAKEGGSSKSNGEAVSQLTEAFALMVMDGGTLTKVLGRQQFCQLTDKITGIGYWARWAGGGWN